MAGESARNRYESMRNERLETLRRGRWLLVGLAVISGGVGAAVTQTWLGVWWVGVLMGLLPVVQLLMPSQGEVAWRKGAEGEASVGRALDNLSEDSWALHDRLIPGSRANIDHILVSPTGIWTVDAKNYSGRIETRARNTELRVNGRNRSKLLDQALRQQEVVASVLREAGFGTVPVRPALCFVGVEWPLMFAPTRARDVALVSPRRLRRLIDGDRPVPLSVMRQVTYALEQRLVPAVAVDRRTPPTPTTPAAQPSSPVPATLPVGQPSAGPASDAGLPHDLTVKEWKRYGKHRLYVNRRDGTTVGFIDLQTNNVSAENEHDHRVVREIAAVYLREG